MHDLLKDIRFALRLFARSPGYTLASVLVLAIGIGAVTVMFSTLNSVALRPLPYDEPDALTWMWATNEARRSNSISAENYWDYRDQAQAFESLGAFLVFRPQVVFTGGDEPERVVSTLVSANMFSTLGVSPQLGRPFLMEEEQAGAERVVILSDGFWQRRFGGDAGVVSTSVLIGGAPYLVAGVMPPRFDFPGGVDLWFPMERDISYTSGRANNNFFIVGRLKDDVSIEQAQAEVDIIARRLEETYPDTNDGWGVRLQSMHDVFFGDVRSSLLILLGLVGLVLLVACANVASLALARAVTRSTELAVRFSLGAARSRVVRQLLTESLLVALAGGAVGLALTYVGSAALKAAGPANLPRLDTLGIDVTVLGFALAVSLLTSLLFGVVPALRGTTFSLSETLKTGGMRGGTQAKSGFRNALVVSQVALSLILMIASGLLARSYLKLQNVDAGFHVEHLLNAGLQLPDWRYTSPEETQQAWDEVHTRIRALPGVTAVGAIDQVPIRSGGTWNTVYPAERPPATAAERARFGAQRRIVSDGYFDAVGIPVLAGRALAPTDRVGTPEVMVISKTMAERYFPDESPLGKELFFWGRNWQVIGVAGDVREFGPAREFPAVFYIAARQMPFPVNTMQILIRTVGDPLELAPALRQGVWEFDGEIPITGLQTMETRVSDSLAQPRFRVMLVALFAVTALVLASMGLYGVLAFFVRQRTHELGIRVALGARPGNVLGLVMRRGMTLVGVGIGIGLLGGFAGGRVLQSFLFEVAPTDFATYAGVSLCLAAVGLAACLLPALRAVWIDAQEVLRVE